VALSIQSRLSAALEQATEELLTARAASGFWVGELSSSALSTATAVCAFAILGRETRESKDQDRISAGLDWLSHQANQDGGWGDTVLSLSNLSTTVLVWAAFGAMPGADKRYRETVGRAEAWIREHAGGLERAVLAPAIIRRYGKDRTFSAPILTMCALAGRLGSGAAAWEQVIPLPFELAACPHQWFAALRMPVVSYALPALIAIGQARHYHLPSRNPILRLVRQSVQGRTLKVLEAIQPSNGGFLEATPLTSFVTMSLAGSGQAGHIVCQKGREFLKKEQRQDGSWPIDTNLATWLTTLSVNALPEAASPALPLGLADRSRILEWLLSQQYQREHPYTHAAPGGWAWTDLPGGVPDADDTAGALLALRKLGSPNPESLQAAVNGVSWLLNLQNKDGGIPTFCRGWGALPFDRSSADLTAHALRAWVSWRQELPAQLQARVTSAIGRGIAFLCRIQSPEGSWSPLWFGNQFSDTEENPTYGTSRVVFAFSQLSRNLRDFLITGPEVAGAASAMGRGLEWLLTTQNADGSWGGFRKGPASLEETALALEAVAGVLKSKALPPELSRARALEAVRNGANWLVEAVESGRWRQPAPIGFYFARLWYYERLYPLIFTVAALRESSNVLH
jgi:squalene-hopene/tetraprenyl-beta-curcumene cyclase